MPGDFIPAGPYVSAVDAKVADAINDGTTTVAPSQNAVYDALALKAPLASPTFTGTPEAPTASAGTNTTQVATTAYVQTEAGLLVSRMTADPVSTGILSFANPKQGVVGSNPVPTVGYIIAFLAFIPYGRAFDRIGVTVAGTVATATVRIAYHRIGTDGYPGAQIVSHSGTLDCSTPGAKTATVSATGEGWCWCVIQTGGATTSYKGSVNPIVLSPIDPLTNNCSMFSPRSDAAIASDLTGFSWATRATSNFSVGMWRPA